MKTPFFLILFTALSIVSCKKKDIEPTPPKSAYALKHSGTVDLGAFNLDTAIVSQQLMQMTQWDALPYKSFEIETWLKGPYLGDNISAGEERLTLNFYLVLQYNLSEYDSNCSCLPTPTATRLANHINSSSFEWNDASERKEVQVMAINDQFGQGSFQIVNPQISAQAIGSAIRIYGTIDSLKVGSSADDRFLTNLHFDYTMPVNP